MLNKQQETNILKRVSKPPRRNQSTSEPNIEARGMKQIEEKGYAREYATDNRTIYLIGCNFSSKTGTIDDWKSKGKSV